MNIYEEYGFSHHDFEKLFIPVFDIGSNYKKHLSLLNMYEEFANADKEFDFDTLLRYIVLAFDINSPIRYVYKTILEQRVKAALIAGFTINKAGKFPKYVEEMLLCENPNVNRIIVRYISIINNEDYSTLVVYSEALRKQQEKILAGDINQEKTKDMIANVNTLKNSIKELKETLLGESHDLQRTLYHFVSSDNLGISPEEVATLYDFTVG